MPQAFSILIALALVPFGLLPTILARTSRSRRFRVVLVCNLLLVAWVAGGFIAWQVQDSKPHDEFGRMESEPLFNPPPLILGVSAWLVLLGLSLRTARPAQSALDEDVELVAPNESWPAQFEAERRRLAATLDVEPAAIEHIGSTAVPGLLAKPVIDIMIGVTRYPPVPQVPRLVILGYEDFGEAGVPERRYLRLRDAQAVNVHIVLRGGTHWTNNLAVRELLRGDAAARDAYAAAKRAALQRGGPKLMAYSGAKADAMNALLAKARG